MKLLRALSRAAVAIAITASMSVLHADRATEIMLIHTAAIGGRSRLAALQAYRAVGRVLMDGRSVGLTVIAARPDRLRVEMRYEDQVVVQGTDGINPPWQLETGTTSRCARMSPSAAEAFLTEAEFDDPLVGAADYGCAIDFAGETAVGEQRYLRLLVTQRLTKSFYLLVDPVNFLIMQRMEGDAADPNQLVTQFGAFRPVGGVLAPHRITVFVRGKLARDAILERVEANPVLPANTFAMPE